jgi:hypothetical protein
VQAGFTRCIFKSCNGSKARYSSVFTIINHLHSQMKPKLSPKDAIGRWLSRTEPSLDVQEPTSSIAGDTNQRRDDEEESPAVSSTTSQELLRMMD